MKTQECPDCDLRQKSVYSDDVLWTVRRSTDLEFLALVCSLHLPNRLSLLRGGASESEFNMTFRQRPGLERWTGRHGQLIDEWKIEQLVTREWTDYQLDLLWQVQLHGCLAWDDVDHTGKRWNRATVASLGDVVMEDPSGQWRAIITEAGEEIVKRIKERQRES